MSAADAPVLAGIHHLKLPVTDLARSLEWYRSRLGYQVQVEFVEQGTLMGVGWPIRPEGRTSACGSTRTGPAPPPDSITSPSACRTRPPSTVSPAGWTNSASPRRRAPGQPGLDPARGARPGRARAALLHHGAPHRRGARRGEPRSAIPGKPPSGSNARKPAARSAGQGCRPRPPAATIRATRQSPPRGSTSFAIIEIPSERPVVMIAKGFSPPD
jgi:catechol 2,3-dioxygenase-like lactoylglutathione lyase family enzyme